MARTTDFSDINFNCLLLIFKLLHNLEDQVNFALCGRRFRDAFVYIHRRRFEEIVDSDIKLKSLDDWRAFLWMCGATVKSLECHRDDDHPLQLMPLVAKYCSRLESITLRNATVARTQPFLLQLSTLRKVYVRNYKSTSKDLIRNMRFRLPYIQNLGLECFERRELQELRYFVNLEELQMYDEVTSSDFIAITKSLRSLRILQLRNAKRFLTTQTLKHLAAHCGRLEKLSFQDSDAELTALTLFPYLRYLQLYCPDNQKTRLFKTLANKCAPHLEYLILHRKQWIDEEQAHFIGSIKSLKWLVCKPRNDSCVHHLGNLTQLECLSVQCARDIGETELLHLVRNNDQLRYLNICYCLGITDSFVVDLLDILVRRHNHQPLELYAAATDIRHDIMEKLPADYASKLLILHFECSQGIRSSEHYYNDEPEFDR
ncbi:uncharacterized protein LOC133845658 [Drosophila sulfurigaster albostrigata]|uniref:uncharacterized protein LOC133845658 n=1 Tax=Drosophila sulfurigaster albostrigata TaxID=89887 RepID=UPI002D21C59B|nr:uncharacterized protein LOC133845658 [Drosophila sulfurigaster albostrigata]